jgi:crossover junction endodeoxyribonuclease RusA
MSSQTYGSVAGTLVAVEFTAYGVPAPQGSKNPFGGESNPRTKPWRADVKDKAVEAMGERLPLLGAVKATVVFVFPRPKAHYRTGKNAHLLRDDAPLFHGSKRGGDTDKLQRAIGDALTGVVYRDDSQIAAWDVAKVYGDRAGAHIRISEATEEDLPDVYRPSAR